MTGPLRSYSPFHASTNSLTSLANIGCTHRQHRQLERLRSLRLDNNHLKRFVVSPVEELALAANEYSAPGSKPVDVPSRVMMVFMLLL
jgi:hypothetical protein